MKIPQVSIFIENKVGRLADIAATLGEIGVNIRAMSLADTSEFGILRLVVDKTDEAVEMLKTYGYAVRVSPVMAVEIPDRPGGLGELLNTLQTAALNIEYMYAFVQKHSDTAVMILRIEDIDRALSVITEKGYPVITADQLYRL